MIFSSIPFLFYYLPAVIILYFLAPKRAKNAVLLAASLFFYAWGEPRYLIFMVAAILQGYIFGLLTEKFRGKPLAKVFLILSLVISLGLLGYCKYADFFITSFNSVTGLSVATLNIALPIGISFYTFQILSYNVDVYRGDIKAQRNIITLAAYVAMFPQLIAGPIVRYSDIAAQLENRTHTLKGISEGTRRFVLGLAKKVLVANILGEVIQVYKLSDEKSVLFAWIYAAACMLHIYFDFSGYSDMAIGLGKIFGFSFPENFNYPFISKSATEFWRRWHISLGSWFRDYLYIPMGGNRVPKWRWLINIFVVWLATGLWHGAAWNFVLWGLIYAVLLVVEKFGLMKILDKAKPLAHIYVLLVTAISFIIFDSDTIGGAFGTIGSMFGAGNLPLVNAESVYYLRSYAVVLIIAAIGSTPLPKMLVNKLAKLMPKKAEIAKNNENGEAVAVENSVGNTILSIAEPVCLIALLAVTSAFLIDGSFNPFLYFRF